MSRGSGGLEAVLARAAADLAAADGPEAVGAHLASAFDELFDAAGSTVWWFDREGERLVRLSPDGDGAPPAVDLSALPPGVARRLPLARSAAMSPRVLQSAEIRPLSHGEGGRLAVALSAGGGPVGLVVVPADGDVPDAVEALASLGGAAVERHTLLDVRAHQTRQLEILYELTGTLVNRGDAQALCARLGELLAPDGYEVTGLVFRQRDLARHLGSDEATAEEQAAWATDGWTGGDGDEVGVPLRLGERIVGTLRVRLPVTRPPAWRGFLEALGGGVAQVAARSALRAALEQSHRERALAQERERIAAEVHETIGVALEAVDARLRRVAEELPEDLAARGQILATAGLADGAKWHLEQAIRALEFVPTAHMGLDAALRRLGSRIEQDSGITVLVEVVGRAVRLPGRVERALYRVASEALAAAWRYARCSVVSMQLTFEPSAVALRVRDDGVGLAQRQERGAPATTLHALRRAIAEVGGQMDFRAVTPHGMELEVTVTRATRPNS